MRRTMFPPEFANDMNLHSYRYAATVEEPIEHGFTVPSQMMEIMNVRDLNYSFSTETSASNWSSYHGENFNDSINFISMIFPCIVFECEEEGMDTFLKLIFFSIYSINIRMYNTARNKQTTCVCVCVPAFLTYNYVPSNENERYI